MAAPFEMMAVQSCKRGVPLDATLPPITGLISMVSANAAEPRGNGGGGSFVGATPKRWEWGAFNGQAR
jgi:hypothetical protein